MSSVKINTYVPGELRDEDPLWLDATGRKIKVGDVLTHATRRSSHLEIHLCIVREIHSTTLTVDKWGFWKKEFTRSYIRVAQNATITGMTEEELNEHLGRKTEPLTPEFPTLIPYHTVQLQTKGIVIWDDGSEQDTKVPGDIGYEHLAQVQKQRITDWLAGESECVEATEEDWDRILAKEFPEG